MPITNRNLPPGARLTGTYRNAVHTLLVLGDAEAGLAFELDDATIHTSLSAAGSAVMGGVSCNGWRFWSYEGDEPPATDAPPKATKATKPRAKRTRRAAASTGEFAGMDDARLRALIESIRGDVDALEGDVLEESRATLERAEAELSRRGGRTS